MIEIHLPVYAFTLHLIELKEIGNPACVVQTISTKAIRNDEEEAIKQLKTMTKDDINHSRGGNHDSNDFEVGGGTALHWAAYYGKVKVAEELLKKGASMLA